MRRHHFCALVFAALAALALANPSGAQTLKVGLDEDPTVLDPAQSGNLGERQVFAALCDKLVDIDPTGKLVPMLATSWELSSDAKSITLSLRKGVVFHDGEPFNAAAVKFNIERSKTLEESRRKSELGPVDTVDVVDDYTVRFNLKQPYAPLLAQLADRSGMMISPKAAKAMSPAEFGAHPVCSGPFTFVERVPQERVVVKKFDKHWNAANIHFDQITYVTMPDSVVRFSNVLSGQLDIGVGILATDIKRGEADPRIHMYSTPGLGFDFLHINMGSAPKNNGPISTNPKLREALELSIDRNALVTAISNGAYLVGNQPVPPTSPYYIKDLPVPSRNLERAKQLVKEAGFTRVPITLLILNTTMNVQGAQVIQSMARDAGFDIKIDSRETGTAEDRYFAGDFEMFWGSWSGRVDPDGNIGNWLMCQGGANLSTAKYCNENVDKYLATAKSASAFDDRYKAYSEAAHIYLVDRPIIVMFHQLWVFAATKRLEGFKPYVDSLIRPAGLTLSPS
jgi:peptide/nickel transport system substrate-binding protein